VDYFADWLHNRILQKGKNYYITVDMILKAIAISRLDVNIKNSVHSALG
jgi:hypothetical protein